MFLTQRQPEQGRMTSQSFSPKALFRQGEQGVWYDPSDIRTGTSEYAVHDGTTTNYFSTPDSEASSVTGDITILWSGKLASVAPSSYNALVDKHGLSGEYSYSFYQEKDTGKIFADFNKTGTTTNRYTSTVTLASEGITANTRIWLYVQRVASTGLVKFFYSLNGTTYTQLGADVSGVSGNIYNSTAPLGIGIRITGTEYPLTGKTYLARIYAGLGISGTPVVDFDPTRYISGNGSFTGSTGEVWTLNNQARIESADTTYSMFQEAAGITPVTRVGQPVGLILDKSKGLVLGPELVTNGGFDSDTAWSKDYATSVIANGKMTVVRGDTSGFWQGSYMLAGHTYLVTLSIIAYVSGQHRILVGAGVGYQGPYKTSVGTFTEVVTPTVSGSFYIQSVGSSNVSFDNISVKELPGNHAYQTTSTKRPVLSARVNLLTYTEDTSNIVWITPIGVTKTYNSSIAPNGTLTADKFEATTTTPAYIYQTLVNAAAGTYRISCSIKKGMSFTLTFDDTTANGNGSTFDGTTGAFVTNNPLGTPWTVVGSSCITHPQNSDYWFAYTDITSPVGTSKNAAICINNQKSPNYVSTVPTSVGDNLTIWGFDVRVSNQGVNLPTYQRVDAATDYDTTGFPKYLAFDGTDDFMQTNSVDFSTVTSDGLTRRNLLPASSRFGAGDWSKSNVTITMPGTADPIGGTEANLIDFTNGNGYIFQNFTRSAVQYTQSIYAKAGTLSTFIISFVTAGYGLGASCTYSLTGDGSVSAITHWGTSTGFTASITNVGNGWYRCTLTGTATAASWYHQITTTGATGTLNFWGGQVETGSLTSIQNIGTDKITATVGVRKQTNSTTGLLYAFGANYTIQGGIAISQGNDNKWYAFSSGTVQSSATTPVATTAPITHVLSETANIAAPYVKIRLNGAASAETLTTMGVGNYGNNALYLGINGSGLLYPFNGNVYGFIIRGAQSTTPQLKNTEKYLNQRTKAY